jgi:hypothetical protein
VRAGGVEVVVELVPVSLAVIRGVAGQRTLRALSINLLPPLTHTSPLEVSRHVSEYAWRLHVY